VSSHLCREMSERIPRNIQKIRKATASNRGDMRNGFGKQTSVAPSARSPWRERLFLRRLSISLFGF
jgi:hypothetical protein